MWVMIRPEGRSFKMVEPGSAGTSLAGSGNERIQAGLRAALPIGQAGASVANGAALHHPLVKIALVNRVVEYRFMNAPQGIHGKD